MKRTITGTALAGAAVLAGEVLYVARRPLPSFDGFDASGAFGGPAAPRVVLLALGDSTMTGPGLDGPDDIWLRVLARRLGADYRVELHSLAVGGAKSRDVLAHQVPRAIELDADVTLISVGGNDALRGVPVHTFERNLEAITAAMVAASGRVVLMGVGDVGTIPRFPPPLSQVARMTGKVADRVHIRVAARYGTRKLDHWGESAEAFRDPSVFSPDLFHPNARGHRVWADVAYPAVAAAVAEAVRTRTT
jgi:lysophospholipase L1-like esterase